MFMTMKTKRLPHYVLTTALCGLFFLIAAPPVSAHQGAVRHVDEQVLDKKMSITISTGTLAGALQQIQTVFAVKIAYDPQVFSLESSAVAQQTFEHISLAQLMDRLFVPHGITYREVNGYVILNRMPAKQLTVAGMVRDSIGTPLTGVSVAIQGQPGGAATDSEGRYSLVAPADAVLVFSMLGYASSNIPVNGQSRIDVVLTADASALEEVVVTAIGIRQQKRQVGYATQEVNTDVLAEAKTMNLGSALTGQVAGLTVTNPTGIFQTPAFNLRGHKPLIVLDGVPIETDFYDLSSDDIANINVLKGTSASALYGSRGKNGAILITSKKASEETLDVTVGTNNLFTAGFTVFPETQTEYGNGSNGQYEFWDGADGGISDGDMIWGPKFGSGAKVAQWNSPVRDKQTGEVIPWWGNVTGTVYDDKARYERVPTDWVRHDNLRDFLGTGIVTNNSLSMAYRGQRSSFYASGNYAYQKGQALNSSLQTGNAKFSATFALADNLQLDASLSYNKVYSPNFPRYGYGPKNHMYTILIWMGDDVDGKDLREHLYVPGQEGYRQANYNYAWYNNPYFAALELQQKQDRDVMHGMTSLNWQLLPNLNLQGRASLRQNKTFENMESPKSYMNYGDSRNGDYKLWNKAQLNVDADVLATYEQQLGDNLGLTLNVGGSSFYRTYREDYEATDGLIVPFVYSLANTQGPVQATNFYERKAIRSVYGSANLDIYKALYLNFSARNDWSSTLSTDHNSYFYPSASLSTIISDYVPMPKGIDFLKLYTSWAQVSSDLSPYSIYSTYNKGVTYGSTPSVRYPAGIINPNIEPDKSSTYEAGLATSFAGGRLSLDFTYYNIKEENQILDLAISEASGFTSRKVNGNVYRTHGFEMMAGARPVAGPAFSWDFNVNWSTYARKIEEIYGDEPKFGNLKVGDRADSYYATVWQKSADGQLILNPNNTLPVRDPYPTYLGNIEPDWRLGFQNRFQISKFMVNLDFDGAWGGLMRSMTIEKMWWGGKHPESVDYRDQEYAAGQPVYVPEGVIVTGGELQRDVDGNVISDTRTYTPNTTAVNWQTWSQIYPYQAQVTEAESEKFANVFDRSYIKLRRLSVGYDLTNIVKIGNAKSAVFTLYGYNLLMWKNIPYVDPDYGDDDNLQDPSARYLGFSFNLKF